MPTTSLLAIFILLLSFSIAEAELYQWIGEDGSVTFKDTPPPSSRKGNKVKVYNDSDFASEPPVEQSPVPRSAKKKAGSVSKSKEPLLDPDLESFKTEVVNVYRNPDSGRIRGLLHLKSLTCMQAEPKYEQYLLKAETIQPIPSDAKISVDEVSANAVLPYRGFTFPLRPTHVVYMEFGKKVSSDGRSKTTKISSVYIARDKGRWYLIMPCPTPEGMGRLRDMGLLE